MNAPLFRTGIAVTYFSIQHSFGAVLLTMGFMASVGGSLAYNAILTTAQRVREEFLLKTKMVPFT